MRPLPSVVLTGALALTAAALAVPAGADDARPGADRAPVGVHAAADRPDGRVLGTRLPQTSDGVVGPAAHDVPAARRGTTSTAPQRRAAARQVAPGVTVQTWNEATSRGPIRAHLTTIKWRTPGLSLDYANAGKVGATATLGAMIRREGATTVAGVNGDFFDIGRTGAPLGLGRDRERGLLHGPRDGWNAAFSIDKAGNPDIGSRATFASVVQYPGVTITNFNSPTVRPNGVGVYRPSWGRASGTRWTDGQTTNVRVVQIVQGRVTSNGTRVPTQGFKGILLVGRGTGAKQLAAMKRGTKAKVTWNVQAYPRMAITGNKTLLEDGVMTVVDDREMHPRTAIGIDRDTQSLLLLVVDGRQSFSRGYTMVELAEKMIDLGAEEALNLDGGGSSTMMSRVLSGAGYAVVNSPSDGRQRSVANAIVVKYRKP
ncbi:phosphodiester glycosidase family protein [Nocardioides sp. C4-1]|uniref:phosphodiester glycosidase family protein n=1 Tax=Nocardioides sp. C4-1 TaxID=3151851 RepID=UPI00326683ED